jgi:hypothetical protein
MTIVALGGLLSSGLTNLFRLPPQCLRVAKPLQEASVAQ